MPKRRRRFHRGSAYVAVLGSAMIVTVIGLSAMLAMRVQNRSAGWMQDVVKARTYAQCGVQWAFYQISSDEEWRTSRPNGQWVDGRAIHDGSFSVWVTDPSDGDLADSPRDPVLVQAAGYSGQARQLMSVELPADLQPLGALTSCLHAGGNVRVRAGKSIALVGAPLSTNADVYNEGTINGDVQAATISRTGVITGAVTCPAPAKPLPYDDVFEMYRGIATNMFDPGTIDGVVISPGSNPFGLGLNGDGVYYIDTGGSDLLIKNTRIHGTLVVRCPGKKVTLDHRVLLHNYRSDYPVLVVYGSVELKLRSATENLDEASYGNMNPPGSPYEGVSDLDIADVYPSEVRGLIHAREDVYLKESTLVRGVIVCEGAVDCDNDTRIVHNPDYATSPPMGYTYAERMKIAPGSWKKTLP